MKQKVQSRVQFLLFPKSRTGEGSKRLYRGMACWGRWFWTTRCVLRESYKSLCARCLSQPGKEKDLKDLCYIFLDRVSQPRLILSSLCNSGRLWTPDPFLSSGITDEHSHAPRSGYVLSMLRMQDLRMQGKHLPVKLCLQPSAFFPVCLSIYETTITYFLRWLMKVRVIWDSEVTQTIKLTTWRQQSLSTWVRNSGFWTKIVALIKSFGWTRYTDPKPTNSNPQTPKTPSSSTSKAILKAGINKRRADDSVTPSKCLFPAYLGAIEEQMWVLRSNQTLEMSYNSFLFAGYP